MSELFSTAPQAAPILVQLLKGVLYRDRHEALWQDLLGLRAVVRDYFAIVGLELVVDEAEGYAFLRQRDAEEEDGGSSLPRLIPRRPLSYPQSLLCLLLRKRLVEQDAGGGETRVILSRAQIVDMMRVYLPDAGNEAKTVEQINRHINRIVDYGFLRPMKGEEERFEVRRILKALVTADWLSRLDERLADYRRHAEQE